MEEQERRRRWSAAIELIRAEQDAGRVVADLDPDLLLVALVALATYPVASGPLVRMVTGTNPTDPVFRRRYAAFLETLYAHLDK